jgi:hypothetical protein
MQDELEMEQEHEAVSIKVPKVKMCVHEWPDRDAMRERERERA